MVTTAKSVVTSRRLIACVCLILLIVRTSNANDSINSSSTDLPRARAASSPAPHINSVDRSSTIAFSTNSTISSGSSRINVPSERTVDVSKALPAAKTSHILIPNVPHGPVAPSFETSDAFSTVVYVVVGLTVVILIYMVVKNFRRRYATVRAERYGVRRRWKDQELQPLGKDDDDEDTLFEARGGFLEVALR